MRSGAFPSPRVHRAGVGSAEGQKGGKSRDNCAYHMGSDIVLPQMRVPAQGCCTTALAHPTPHHGAQAAPSLQSCGSLRQQVARQSLSSHQITLLLMQSVARGTNTHAFVVRHLQADAPTSNAAPVAEVDATPAAAPETHAPSNDTRVLTSSIGDRTSSSIGSSSSNTAAAPTALLVERQAAARELIQPPTDEPEQQEEQDLVSEDDPAVLYQYQQQLQQQQQQQEEAEEQQQQKQGYAAWQGSVAEAASGSTHPAFQRLSASGQQQQHTSPAPAPAPTSTLPAGPAAASSPSPSLLNTPLAPVFALAAIAAFVYTRVKKRHAEAKDSSSKSGGVAAKEQAGAAGPLDMASKTPGVGTAKPGGRGGSSGSLFRRPASQTGAGAAPGAGAAGVGGAKTLAPLPAVPGEGPLSGAASGTQAGGGAGAGVAAAAAGAGSAGAAGAAAGPTPRSTVARERGWWRRLRKLYYISFGAQYGIVPFVRMALASGGLAARSAVRPLMGGGGGAGGGGGGLMGGAGGGEMSIVAFEDPADAEYVANLLWEDLLLRGGCAGLGARALAAHVMCRTTCCMLHQGRRRPVGCGEDLLMRGGCLDACSNEVVRC